ncbi:MAG: MFS transporter [Oscillospiraceae bacterium]|nr:MFS transporter [Oscillospiraceae bacterium]
MKRSITFRYTFHQMAYWATAAGIVSFATAFLLEKGFAASRVGILLAAGNLLSCGFQPILADWADRTGGNVIKWLTVALTAFSGGCFLAVQLLPLEEGLFGLLYLLGVFAFDAMNPLMNAIGVSYMNRGYSLNYGFSRGLGSLAYALAALLIGKVMARFGADWMVWISLGLLAVNIAMAVTYPSLTGGRREEKAASQCCSIPVFFRRYKWYCVSLLGVMLLGMFHAMTENYLIEIVIPLGGDSGSVGVALFLATAVEAAVLVYFDRVRRRISDGWLLKIAGISFLAKAVLLLLASDVRTIYFIQLLQATSYTFLSPTQMYYANAKVGAADMVKGQAFITASYTLGCAAGNFAGGQLLSAFSVPVMLVAGVAMAAVGTLIFFLTVDKRDIP